MTTMTMMTMDMGVGMGMGEVMGVGEVVDTGVGVGMGVEVAKKTTQPGVKGRREPVNCEHSRRNAIRRNGDSRKSQNRRD